MDRPRWFHVACLLPFWTVVAVPFPKQGATVCAAESVAAMPSQARGATLYVSKQGDNSDGRSSTEGKSPIGYTVKGKVQAYVQFEQPVPDGIERLTRWPVDLFGSIAPPGGPSNKEQ